MSALLVVHCSVSAPFLTRRPEGRSALPGDIGMRVGGRDGSPGLAHRSSIDPALLSSGEGGPATICRSLPIRLPPVDGEALDSYLEALAYRSHTPWGDLLRAVGLDNESMGSGTGIYGWLVGLTGSQSSALSRSTGVRSSQLASMTVAGLMRSPNAAMRPAGPVPILRAPERSRYCPMCLAESGGRWQLWWRLRWAIACPIHHCLLADCCPTCGGWQRVGPSSSGTLLAPGLCSRKVAAPHGRRAFRCGAALSGSAVHRFSADHLVLRAQRRVLKCLAQQWVSDGIYVGGAVDVSQFFADVAAIGNRVLRLSSGEIVQERTPSDLVDLYAQLVSGGAGQAMVGHHAVTAGGAALALIAALDVLGSPDVKHAGARMRWIVATPGARTTSVTATHFGKGRTVSGALRAAQLSALETYLGPSDQLRYRIGAHSPSDPTVSAERHRHVPSLLWLPATRCFAPVGIATEQLAATLACAVVVVGTRMTLAEAAWRLESVTTAPAISRVLQKLSTAEEWAGMRAALIRVADDLDAGACPIDYERRRALPFYQLMDGDEWCEICCDAALQAGPILRVGLLRSWMFERMTGSPAHRCPTAERNREFRRQLSELTEWMTPNLAALLDRFATKFLEKHGCGGEPLMWHPSDKLLPG